MVLPFVLLPQCLGLEFVPIAFKVFESEGLVSGRLGIEGRDLLECLLWCRVLCCEVRVLQNIGRTRSFVGIIEEHV